MTNETRNRIIAEHYDEAIRLGRAAARRVHGLACCDREDLEQVALLALVRAASRVEPRHAQQGSALAYIRICIAGGIRRHIRDHGRLVRVSRRAHESREWPLGHDSLDAENGLSVGQVPAPEPDETDGIDLAVLDRLPASEAAAVRMVILDGLTLRRAGEVAGTNRMTMSRRVARGLSTLRRELEAS